MHFFAQAEAAVSETLLLLAGIPAGGARVQLRRLVGQRFEDLRMAVSAEGPFGKQGPRAAAALAAFLQHESLRPILCHGTARVTVDRQGEWVAIFKLLAFRGREAERMSVVLEQREAEALLAALKLHTQKLASALQSLRSRIAEA